MDIFESESSTLLVGIMRWINMLLNGVLKSGPDFNENTEKLFHAVQNSPYFSKRVKKMICEKVFGEKERSQMSKTY